MRRELAFEAAELAAMVSAAGFPEDAAAMVAAAKRLAPGLALQEVTVGVSMVAVEDLHGPDLVWHLLAKDRRNQAWLAEQLPGVSPGRHLSTSQVSRIIRGELPITERVSRALAGIWPEYGPERFVTSAAAARRAS